MGILPTNYGNRSSLKQTGFTLIEMLIVVAIIAILAAIAYPSYQSQVQKTRRAEAKSALTTAAAAQERWYTENNQYSSTLSNIAPTATENGYYNLSLPSATSETFTLTATATGAQSADTDCATMSITHTGEKTSTDSASNPSTGCW